MLRLSFTRCDGFSDGKETFVTPALSRPKVVRCKLCGQKIKVKAKGPLPLFHRVCRQRAYEKRRHGGLMAMLAQDVGTLKVREIIRAEVRSQLSQMGLNPPSPPPPPAGKKRQDHLRLVSSDIQNLPLGDKKK